MRPLDSAVAPLGVTGVARCHSDWSDEHSEERNGGISGEHNPVHPVNINTVALARWHGISHSITKTA